MVSFDVVDEYVKKALSERRYFHSKCVVKGCVELAKIYGVDKKKAELVGIAHDVAKEMSRDEKLDFVEKNGIEADEVELKSPELLHAKIGGYIGVKEFGFSEDMGEAIANHTTGKPNMDILSKILFVADATSEDRDYHDREDIFNLAKTDLDSAILIILDFIINDIIEKNKMLHSNTIMCRNWILSEME
ncbi:MAG: bis(5'-nucleosyl)-tetraphosphatase (symmetrical) YqeK [Clostridia bacterium]|nr:bis(5'-nucleosyl)-tetraphosphatase (symmetrical) YqeK [Clostridia bacterium]